MLEITLMGLLGTAILEEVHDFYIEIIKQLDLTVHLEKFMI